jgi:ribosome-associated toxin RatA of RatAB toxin-antitoxin module
MNKSNKILIIFYIFLASSYGIYVFTSSEGLEENLLELVLPQKITDFEVSRIVDVPIYTIFDTMADIENFPNIIPKHIHNVNIISETTDTIIAEEELSESGIKIKLLVKHTIKPYTEHVIEIIDGDAKGTIITQYFESVGSQTKLTTNVHLNVEGVTSVITFLPESNLKHATNTIISTFVDYSKFDIYNKKVNSIYEEILFRSADREGLLHYSELLRNDLIAEQELRQLLINSKENNPLPKSIDELNPKTIKIISGLYESFLLREPDVVGLKYYGNLFENGTTRDELREIFLDSDEAKSHSRTHIDRSNIIVFYNILYDEFPENDVVDYYHKMIDDDVMIFPDWILDIVVLKRQNAITGEKLSIIIHYLYDEKVILIDRIPLN